jgi:hypothetical protein
MLDMNGFVGMVDAYFSFIGRETSGKGEMVI